MKEEFVVNTKIVKQIYHKDSFYIFSCSPIIPYDKEFKLSKYGYFTIKGDLGWATVGKEYKLELSFVEENKYGVEYKVVAVPTVNIKDLANLSREESFEILTTEITTEAQANHILDAYPNFIYLALNEGVEAIDVKKIYNVKEFRLNAYIRMLNEKFKYLAIMSKIKEWKIDMSDCKELTYRYDNLEKIQEALKENPYKVLIDILEFPFIYSDKIIMDNRPDLKETELRCSYLIQDALRKNEIDGGTKINANVVYNFICNEYNIPELVDLIVPTVQNNSEMFYYNEETKDLANMSTYMAECKIADFIKNRIENSITLDIDCEKYRTNKNGVKLSDKQFSCIDMFCKNNFMIVAGYSGAGKTMVIRSLVELIEDNDLSYDLLSFTGKAVRRIEEVTHRNASTIHRKCMMNDEIWSDVIIIDEMSMTDIPTFCMLLNRISCNEKVRVVLVGDNAQLLPVGMGCIFNDMINSGKCPMVILDEVFRYNTDGGLFVATNVRKGINFFDSDVVKQNGNEYKVYDNYKFIETDDIFETLLSEYKKLIKKGVKPKDILCLSPFNVGDTGTYQINNAIQSEINPPKTNEEKCLTRTINGTKIVFRLGDRVLNKKNDYRAIPLSSWELMQEEEGLQSDDVDKTSVANGQEGIIREVDEKKLVIQFDEELIVFDKPKIKNLLLGNCISVHSSQGSEAKYVLNVISPQHKKMLNRELLYVADTRGKTQTIDIGDRTTYQEALLVRGVSDRNTFLKGLLEEI